MTMTTSTTSVIFKSNEMKRVMDLVDRVADSRATILVTGESGTGKELIARKIHDKSPRANKPFVAINCGALRETLLESELFGHEKGSFTGAYTRKIGLLEVANGGTLFLDEVAELTPGIQAKLLRFLQEGEIFRVGGNQPIKVNARLISASYKDLETEVSKGRFREDLYYRVNTITLSIPALRYRGVDVPLLIQYFFDGKKTVSKEAMAVFKKYQWPGNVRELQNTVERLTILTESPIIEQADVESLLKVEPVLIQTEYDPELSLHELEKRYIVKSLRFFGGNKTKAAGALGITIKTLYNKLHEYGLFEERRIAPVETIES